MEANSCQKKKPKTILGMSKMKMYVRSKCWIRRLKGQERLQTLKLHLLERLVSEHCKIDTKNK